jgi:ribosomal protein S28E/S33
MMVFLILFWVVGIAGYSEDYGGVSVFPVRLVFSERSRVGKLFVKNHSSRFATVRMIWKYKIMNEKGELVDGPQNMDVVRKMIVFVPRILYLDPGEGQVVRFVLRLPPDIKPGEYHSHLMFVKETETTIQAQRQKGEKKEALTVPIIVKYGVAVPIVVRVGNLSSTMKITNIEFLEGKNKDRLILHLERSGNKGIWGGIKVLKDNKEIAILNGVGIYPEITKRIVTININKGMVKKGDILHIQFLDKDANSKKPPIIFEGDFKVP